MEVIGEFISKGYQAENNLDGEKKWFVVYLKFCMYKLFV